MLDRQCRADAEIQGLLDKHYIAVHIDLGHGDKHMDLGLEYGLVFNELRIAHMTILDEDGEPVAQRSTASLVTFKDGATVYSEKRIVRMLDDYRSKGPPRDTK